MVLLKGLGSTAQVTPTLAIQRTGAKWVGELLGVRRFHLVSSGSMSVCISSDVDNKSAN